MEADETDTEYIMLKVVGQDLNEIYFRVKMTSQMDKLSIGGGSSPIPSTTMRSVL